MAKKIDKKNEDEIKDEDRVKSPTPIRNIVFISIVSVLGLIILIGAIALISNSNNSVTGGAISENTYNSQASSQKSCKDVQVPYEEQETYYETVPYTDQECENKYLSYKKENGACNQFDDDFWTEDDPASYSCTITNLDDIGGTFSVDIGFDIDGQKNTEIQNKYIYPQSSATFYSEKMAYIDNCYCNEESIPSKQICRDVIKYRDVQRTRTVTKYKTEQICD